MRSDSDVLDAVKELRFYLRHALANLEEEFPEGKPPSMDISDMSDFSGDYPLHMLATPIDGVLATFDALQESLGRRKEECRHYYFLRGMCICR